MSDNPSAPTALSEPHAPEGPKAQPPVDAGEPTKIQLPSELDMLAAEPLRRQLLAAIDAQLPLVIDGEEVERFSTPCAQVLLAALRSAEAAGVTVRLARPSSPLIAGLTDLGLLGSFSGWVTP